MNSSRLLSIIHAATIAARELATRQPGRELSLTITKLDEAHLWASRINVHDAGPVYSSDELLERLVASE